MTIKAQKFKKRVRINKAKLKSEFTSIPLGEKLLDNSSFKRALNSNNLQNNEARIAHKSTDFTLLPNDTIYISYIIYWVETTG